MSNCMLILPSTPKNCAECKFKEQDSGCPADCMAIILTNPNGLWTKEASIEKYVATNTKSPYCPLKAISDP